MLHKYHKTNSVVVFTLTKAWTRTSQQLLYSYFLLWKMQTGFMIDSEDIVVKTVCKD